MIVLLLFYPVKLHIKNVLILRPKICKPNCGKEEKWYCNSDQYQRHLQCIRLLLKTIRIFASHRSMLIVSKLENKVCLFQSTADCPAS